MSHLGAAHATELGADGGPVLRLSVSGVSASLTLRKDADGRLGLQFVEGTPSGSVQGAVVASVLPRSAARDAGLRGGDLVYIMVGIMVCTCAGVRARARVHICVRVAHSAAYAHALLCVLAPHLRPPHECRWWRWASSRSTTSRRRASASAAPRAG